MQYIKDAIKYYKDFITGKTGEEINNLSEELTEEQKKKYRKQYIKLACTVLAISVAYILGTITLIYELFDNGKLWAIVILVILLRDYTQLAHEWSKESELIQERIKKRALKNRKQNKVNTE